MKFSKVDLYNSVQKGDVKKTKSILDNGFHMDEKTGEWLLYLAIKNNNFADVKLLREKGASIRNKGILKAKSSFLEGVTSEHEEINFKNSLNNIFTQIKD
jgi:hypothetical protein